MGSSRCRCSQDSVSRSIRAGLCCVLAVCLAAHLVPGVQAGESNHKYKDSEQVILWVNKVGPYNNPQVSRNAATKSAEARQTQANAVTYLPAKFQAAHGRWC